MFNKKFITIEEWKAVVDNLELLRSSVLQLLNISNLDEVDFNKLDERLTVLENKLLKRKEINE